MNHYKSTLAQNLIAKRKEHKMTQDQLAEWLNIKQKRYAAWEEGRAKPPNEYLIKLAHEYSVTVDELLKAKKDDNSSADKEVQQ